MKDWERIANETIQKAERVTCGLDEFASGLEEIIDALRARLDMVRAEIRENEKE